MTSEELELEHTKVEHLIDTITKPLYKRINELENIIDEMMNNEIKLHTIAVYNNKEYELQDLLNGLLNKLNMLEEYIEELDDETIDTCLYEITKKTKDDLLNILRGDKE